MEPYAKKQRDSYSTKHTRIWITMEFESIHKNIDIL